MMEAWLVHLLYIAHNHGTQSGRRRKYYKIYPALAREAPPTVYDYDDDDDDDDGGDDGDGGGGGARAGTGAGARAR